MYSEVNQGISIRFPSSANLLINSQDRDFGTSADFNITKNQNILTGYFTRMAVIEIVLDFCLDNISASLGNNIFSVQVTGSPVENVTVPDGSYTVETLMHYIVFVLTGDGAPWAFVGPSGNKNLQSPTGTTFIILPTKLQKQLGFVPSAIPAGFFFCSCPNLVPYDYIDFVCSNLTYNQGLKDATTSKMDRDILYRWNLAWDSPAPDDGDGYPIYQGYQRFIARRYLSFPKQIKWTGDMPIGQLQFQVFDPNGNILVIPTADAYKEFEWQMTLLVSEV